MKPTDRPIDVVCACTLASVQSTLAEAGFRVDVAENPLPDLTGGDDEPLRFVLLDADTMGPDLAAAVQRFSSQPGVVPVVVGRARDPDAIVAAMRAGAADYVAADGEGRYLRNLPGRLHGLADNAETQTRQALAERFAQIMAAVQHDVKNPINNILGYVELLTENPGTKLSGDQAHFLQRIAANGTLVLEILDSFRRETVRITGRKNDA